MVHPSVAVLTRQFAMRRRAKVVKSAQQCESAACMHRRLFPKAAETGPTPAKRFNDRLQMDVFFVQLTTRRVAVPAMFGAARVLKQTRRTEVLRVFGPHGPPTRLQSDDARCFCSHELTVFSEHFWLYSTWHLERLLTRHIAIDPHLDNLQHEAKL